MINQKDKEILKVLAGSHAHGLARPESDIDYRGVYISPTQFLLRLTDKAPKGVSWIEGEADDTSYELAHFLHLATKSNPSILEVFVSPVVEANEDGYELQSLFPYVWSSKGVLEAFLGYSRSQQKKMFEDTEHRWKYAVAYLRMQLLAEELLTTGTMTVEVAQPWNSRLRAVRQGYFKIGEVIDIAETLKTSIKKAYEQNPNHQPDIEKINEFLMRMRKKYWE